MNIYHIWIPSEEKIVHTRDVMFNENLFYDPSQPDLASQLRERADQVLEVIEVSSTPQSLAVDLETDTEEEEEPEEDQQTHQETCEETREQ